MRTSDDGIVLCFKERAGRPGGGKGILIEENKTFTLATQLDQMVCYQENGDNTIERHSACYAIDSHPEDSRFRIDESGVAPTITAKMKKRKR